MNIESTTVSTTQKTDVQTSASSSNVQAKNGTKSFKDELNAAKTQDKKTDQADAEVKNAEISNNVDTNVVKTEENVKNNLAQKIQQDKNTDEKNEISENANNSEISAPLNALSSKIAVLSSIKNDASSSTQSISSKSSDKTSDKSEFSTSIKMDNNDITFFLNLVDNQQMSAQGNSAISQGLVNNNITEIKSEATQSTFQVSETLLNAMNESIKTGKSFRIDFDKDIAVVMKVDKEGTISANFIPGSAAVETYLKNNIAFLRQSFDNQNLAYNELSYSKQQKQEQQQRKNKENENE